MQMRNQFKLVRTAKLERWIILGTDEDVGR
jgi:hypothetical protein